MSEINNKMLVLLITPLMQNRFTNYTYSKNYYFEAYFLYPFLEYFGFDDV